MGAAAGGRTETTGLSPFSLDEEQLIPGSPAPKQCYYTQAAGQSNFIILSAKHMEETKYWRILQ